MDATERDIYEWLRRVTEAASVMPEIALSPGERMVLSGHLYQEAEPFVRAVARALVDQPGLYADVRVDAARLLLQQDRAQALRKLQGALQIYAQRAADWYLAEQSAAVREAMCAVQQVRADAVQPFPHPEHRRRAEELRAAEQILRRRRDRMREKKGRAPQEKGAAQRRAALDYARAQREQATEDLAAAMAKGATPIVSNLHSAPADEGAAEKSQPIGWTGEAPRAIFEELPGPAPRRLQRATKRWRR